MIKEKPTMGGAGEAPPPPPPPPPPGEEAAEAAASTDEPPSNSKAAPYEWDPTQQVGTDVLQLWTEVGNGLEKSQTVVWKSAVESLKAANQNLSTSKDARHFVEKYAGVIIGILVEQAPSKIGPHERNCVQESLGFASQLVAKDLEIQNARGGNCRLLETVLNHVLNKKKAFYKKGGSWQPLSSGFPEVRIRNIEKFRTAGGFNALYKYLMDRLGKTDDGGATAGREVDGDFPTLDTIHQILSALQDSLYTADVTAQQQEDCIQIAKAVSLYLKSCSDEQLKSLGTDSLHSTLGALRRIFDKLVGTRRAATVEFYSFWRELVLHMIQSPSLPLKLAGWEQVHELIKAVEQHRPPPRRFVVTEAGCPFVNGNYEYAGPATDEGYAKLGAEISYVREIPDIEPEGAGKKLTLFRCTMRSQQKFWFLSEADEEQPGTDRDIDYYQHKSKEHEEAYPPPAGWITCRNAGVNPPPNLRPEGLMVPPGQEMETLEHQLAKWAIENNIVEGVLGDTTIHREVVARSTGLIQFLASMCTRDDDAVMADDQHEPNKYCLQTSHLLYAWKTCLRKADAAVSNQVYQLLVSIIPLCPSNRAIPLLKAIQTSLHESSEKRDHLFEVSEFCTALAGANLVEVSRTDKAAAVPGTALTEDVREEVLNLLWSVLTHPGVSSLKSYDNLKRYVTHELQVEPRGSEHRERFLRTCVEALTTNASNTGAVDDEVQALRMVKLTRFILEACPRDQADAIVLKDNAALPMLLFNELVAYLERRRQTGNKRPKGDSRKSSLATPLTVSASVSNVSDSLTSASKNNIHSDGLEERLKILRHVYGLSSPLPGAADPISMTSDMLNTLWTICVNNPDDREALMVFIASASHAGKATQYEHFGTPTVLGTQAEPLLSPALSEDVCSAVFLDLFCALAFDYDKLAENGYRSFQFLFRRMLDLPTTSPEAKKTSMDALWRVCLTAGNDAVVKQAMKDLLAVYIAAQNTVASHGMPNGQPASEVPMAVENVSPTISEDSFGDRMFQCLERVKADLESNAPTAERSVERCMRILNAAIGRVDARDMSSAPTLARLTKLTTSPTVLLSDAMKCLPHGLRGQACYRRVGVVAKRPNPQSNQNMVNFENTSPRLPPNSKFTLDIHPLETVASIKYKVSLQCQCLLQAVKLISITGRARINSDGALMNPNNVPEDTVMDELGVVQGCEMVFLVTERQGMANPIVQATHTQRSIFSNDLGQVFFSDDGKFADRLFTMLLSILESLPWKESEEMSESENTSQSTDVHKLVWDLLLSMPTNESVAARVKSTQTRQTDSPSIASSIDDPMEVDSTGDVWSQLLDTRSFDRSVYVLLTIDAFLQPAPEALSIFPAEKRQELEQKMVAEANSFRRAFIEAGGFAAVAHFFSASGSDPTVNQVKTRRGNAVALRILKSCLFGGVRGPPEAAVDAANLATDEAGAQLLQSLTNIDGLLKSLTAMVVDDRGVSASTITDVLRFLRLLFQAPTAAQTFVSLRNAERFLVILLMWDEGSDATRVSAAISAAMHVRRATHDLILKTPVLADHALPWLIHAIDRVDVSSESTVDYFDALEKLVVSDQRSTARSMNATDSELLTLASSVCKKLVKCPHPGNETDPSDITTGVLCGCLRILRALIEHGGGRILKQGTAFLLKELKIERWSEIGRTNRGVLSIVSSPFGSRLSVDDVTLVDLMGAIFDGFLSPSGSSSLGICCDKESRNRGFDVVGAASRACESSIGYMALIHKINGIVEATAPKLCHKWGQFGGSHEQHSRHRVTSKYTGLRNQGCTCYMNSFLQQLFMMSELRTSLCSAPLPKALRTVGSSVSAKGAELVGKKIGLHWDNGVSFDAMVESFNEATGMHTIRYLPIQVANPVSGHPQVRPEEIAKLPPCLPEEFVLSEGRPGKETGVFEIRSATDDTGSNEANGSIPFAESTEIKESEDESSSRHLLEEVQRTFIHLEEGSRGHCFDPRALVEACACLKLEFDVWQQNDASEFATKLLDRLEITLKKWAPKHFHKLDHTFGLKQAKQKICKKCGLKTSREEKLLNIDCQIRGKSDIHEALSSMTEVEIMEGSNQVYCESCKEKTDTILKSAISTLPNMLILSLKRFDLDYNTFETVKLNSRCAFGQTLNMKQYSLDAVEAMEAAEKAAADGGDASTSMEMDDSLAGEVDPLASLPDEDYEYRLFGVLVHAGVAQGGHYYSFIRDRSDGSEEKWFRFDDDDVTPFDPASIETECFGGKVKKESKWPNGQVHTVEQEQFANALMLFYEKVKKSDLPEIKINRDKEKNTQEKLVTVTGYDVFEPDVRQSNETYQWQSFLFDQEFHGFLRGMLSFVSLPKNENLMTNNSDDSWRRPLVHMLLSFVFDAMFYSAECNNLNDWSRMLESILLREPEIAVEFVQKLAKKTREVSSNWLRTFLIECPDPPLRSAATCIFNAAIKSCEASDVENKALDNWCRAWREIQGQGYQQGVAIPCGLEGKLSVLEDTQQIGKGASSLGRILSFTNEMLEAIPRYWRFSPELCVFIRFISSMRSSKGRGESYLRRAIMDCQMPGRLVALVAREPPTALRAYFPGASLSPEVATTQMRAESNPFPHAIALNSNQVLSADMNGSRSPQSQDFFNLLEALAHLIGLPMAACVPVARETEDIARNRHWFTLTEEAMKALTTVFDEVRKGAPGMGPREIESYLKRCRIDQGMASQQKIHDMLTKYPTTGNDGERERYLSLEGFIAYYRDCCQTNPDRLKHDLHVFGFRPDLSRRSHTAMYYAVGERETLLNPISSVAVDVAEIFGDRAPLMNDTTKGAFGNTVSLYTVADSVSEPLMLYLVAASTYRDKHYTEMLIDRTQTLLYKTPTNWETHGTASSLIKMLQVFASIPGNDQDARVQRILLNPKRYIPGLDFGCGILSVLQGLQRMRQTGQYSNDIHWTFGRYLDVLKELYCVYPIFKYLTDHREQWAFIERELQESRHTAQAQHHGRVDYGPLEQHGRIFSDHNNPSDSDMGNMQDSEDEDEDSRFENMDPLASSQESPPRIMVKDAGEPAVNGVYAQEGFFENRPQYVRDGVWRDHRYKFYIFLCNVSNNTKHWYISIVPYGGNPGTSSDIDFYTAPMTEHSDNIPPASGWTKAVEGKDPPPQLVHEYEYEQENERPEIPGNGAIVEDDDMGEQRRFA